MRRRGWTPLVVGAALCWTAPAWAIFGNDEALKALQGRLTAVEERVNRLAIDSANGDAARQQELARLQGAVEELRYKLDQLEKRQRDLFLDLDRRLRELAGLAAASGASAASAPGASPVASSFPSAPAPSPAPAAHPPAPAASSAATGDGGALFNQALKGLQGQQAAAALRDFEAFLAQFPNDGRATEAHFWAGTAALQLKQFEKARQHFARIVFDQPRHELAPDAMLGLANALQGLGDKQGARDMLSRLVERHPNTPAGKIARERLGR